MKFIKLCLTNDRSPADLGRAHARGGSYAGPAGVLLPMQEQTPHDGDRAALRGVHEA